MDDILDIKLNKGLSSEEVKELTDKGLVNGESQVRTKSYKQIVKDNLFTLFNLIDTILLICIIISGSIKNALFYFIVIWNFALGCIQEIRAKKTVEKLSLISSPKVYALRDGNIEEIQSKDVVLGEIMRLKNGNQVCVDCKVLKGSCQVNESMITGESVPINKNEGDELLSGSFLVSGQVMAEAVRIAENGYAAKITKGASYLKKNESVIMRSVKLIVRVITVFLFPLAALMVWNNFFKLDLPFSEAMVATAASITAMVPGGTILLVSVVLAVAVIRLSLHNALTQNLYSVENLARVDTVLLDKTGTITEGRMHVEKIISADGLELSDNFYTMINKMACAIEDDNGTINAVRKFLSDKGLENEKIEKDSYFTVPFSSDKKWSLVYFEGQGSVIMGAPEFVLNIIGESIASLAEEYTKLSKRVVLFAFSPERPNGNEKSGFTLPADIRPMAFAVITDKIRSDAKDTFEFLEREGVSVKVISGDAPVTVSKVAVQAGIRGAESYIDMSLVNSRDIKKAAENCTVFGRVSPYQKCDIVKALKEAGHTVAMIGDGANDVLALKESDCSIAMQSGADAARNVSDIVLLTSDFSVLPLIMAEGRKSVNNLQRSIVLYLSKTVYSFVLTIAFLFISSMTYPFENIQVSFIGFVTIGIPSFILALEENHEKMKSKFLFNVFKTALPTGLMTAAAILINAFILYYCSGADADQISTASTYIAIAAGIILIFDTCGRLKLWKIALVAAMIAASVLASCLFPGLFSLTVLQEGQICATTVTTAVFFLVHFILFRATKWESALFNRFEDIIQDPVKEPVDKKSFK